MKPIKKIKTTTVETFLDIELTPNKTVLGVDVSMHSTGLALIRTTETYLVIEKLDVIKVPKKVKSFLSSADSFLEQLDQIKREIISYINLTKVVIEDCFFGSNVKTLKSLARFGILVYERFRGCSQESHFELPTTARRKIKFKKSDKKIKGPKLKKEIIEYINAALDIELKPTENDKADAVVLALAGLLKEE